MAALRDYLSGMPAKEVAWKYSIRDRSVLSHWKRIFVGNEAKRKVMKNKGTYPKRMQQTDSESAQAARIRELEHRLAQCQNEIIRKERALQQSELRNHLNETIIDIAEEEYNLEIRKKFGSRQ